MLAAAHQRDGIDERGCRYVLEFLSTAAAIRTALHRELADLDLTELGLGVLVVLYALDPTPSTPADLAAHTGAARSAMTEVIDRLQAREFIRRQRDTTDRRLIYIHLTKAGCAAAETALRRFLETAGRLARHVESQAGETLLAACAQLREGCT
jgi:DNA-binding MarR family transcriptional regulator